MMGETLLGGRYRIDRLLGRGGMGAVYEATHTQLARKVAIKILDTPDVAIDAIAATEREARAAAQLAHPHIVQVTDFSPGEGGPPFLVMELLQGESLQQRLDDGGKLGDEKSAFVMVQVLSALAAAHASGIVHRDVKPANIFLTRTAATNDFVKLLDFGIAWSMGPVASQREGARTTAGTPQYMAPEQIDGASVDARTDIWSVGVCLYEMLTGQPPFEGNNVAALLTAIATKTPAPPDSELAAVVMKAIEKNPNDRFENAEAMRVALARFARSEPIPSKALGAAPLAQADTVRRPEDVPTREIADATIRDAGGPPTPLVPPPRPISSPVLATMRSDTPLGPSPPAPTPPASPFPPQRRSWPWVACAAFLAVFAAGAFLFVHARQQPASAASPLSRTLKACKPGKVFPPIGIGSPESRFDLAATEDRVVMMMIPPNSAATFMTMSPEYLDWSPVVLKFQTVNAVGCASSIGPNLFGAFISPKTTTKYHSTVGIVSEPQGERPRAGIAAQSITSRATRARCATDGDYMVLVSHGREYLIADMRETEVSPSEEQLRVTAYDGQVMTTQTWGTGADEAIIEYAVALNGGLVGVAMAKPDGVVLADFRRNGESRENIAITKGLVSEPTIGMTKTDFLLAWVKDEKIEWTTVPRATKKPGPPAVLVEGGSEPTILMLDRERVLFAYAKKGTLYAGTGASLSEAVQKSIVITKAPHTQLHVANGTTPWIGWVEGDTAHVMALECP